MSFHRVIAAFDGSAQSEDALALALRLRETDDGVITLACVVDGGRWHFGPHVHRADAAVPEEVALMFANARATVIPAGIRVRQRAPIAPSPARGLTELAETEGADLLVIGSSRHAAPGRIRLERTAGRLLQGAPCAVAIAPGGLRETDEFHHIGVAFDDSPEAHSALSVAYDLAVRSGAAVSLLFAVPAIGPDPVREEARRHAQAGLEVAADAAPAGVNPRALLLDGESASAIRAACDGIIDLLVTGSRSYGPMHRALMGSVSEALTEGASHPVLVIPRRPMRRDEQPTMPEALEAR